jgi:hypothetical protein
MANPCPKMLTGYHRDRMNLPDQPDSRVEGCKGPTNFSPATTGSQDQPTLIFFEEVKSTLPPLHPNEVKESPAGGRNSGERETPITSRE